MSDHEISTEDKIAIIKQEIQDFKKAQYTLEIRYKVNKNIEAPDNVLHQISENMVKNEQAILAYEEELKALTST
ncbi:MAG: hypothetical protein WC998_01660 [Candidatus Paceibacterota bacterium]|jgi:hypothetical protein